jgi:TnpA family transposase
MLALAECEELAQPPDFRAFAYSARSFRHLRAFMPKFLDLMRFHSDQKSDPVLEAVVYMRQFNAGNRRKMVDAPIDFVPWPWKKYVVTESGEVASRAMYELCLADCLVQALDNGRLWVEHSREHTSFREDWISDVKWPDERKAFLTEHPRLADCEAFIEQMRQMLDERMAKLNRQWPELEDQVKIEDGNIHLSRLEAVSEPEGTEALRTTLQRLLPWRTLPELLVEVNGWTGFADHLTSLNPQEREIPNLTTRKHAAVMAQGMNIGLDNMANAVESMSYRELAWVADWYIREDTLRKAIVELINFLIHLPITQCWGDGTTSSSDGQLFGVRARTLYARVNPHAPHRGAAMKAYFHIADNLAPYYSRVLESTAHEAPYIIGAWLHHETGLKIYVHYADAGGYTDTLFGLSHLLGFYLALRFGSLKERRLFRMRRNLDAYPNIKALFSDPINTRAIREGWEDLLRLTASVKTGVVSAARVLRKLNAHHPETRLYKALREVGRIAKTLFLLDYISDQALRRRVLVGLNKGESYNSLTRALFIGQTGVLKSRAIKDQADQISCLRLLTTAIIVWNAVYIGEAVEHLRAANYQVGDDQLAHIYPMLLKRINLIGEYRFPEDERALTSLNSLPLRSLDGMLVQLSLNL